MYSLPEPLLTDKAKKLCRRCPSYQRPPVPLSRTAPTEPSRKGQGVLFAAFTGAGRSVQLSVLNVKIKFQLRFAFSA